MAMLFCVLVLCPKQNLHCYIYSNPKWFVEGHPIGVPFHKPKKFTNDIGLLYLFIERLLIDL